MYFLIRFPVEYDPGIKKYNLEIESDTLEGSLKYIVRQRDLWINGFYLSDINSTLTYNIKITGISNPNRVDNDATGTFLFGYISASNIISGTQFDGIIPSLAPENIQL